MSQSLTSPLTLQALLASGGGVPQDPAVAAALPRLQMAQAMMQQGTSEAPTTKYGALSRVGQALLGGFTFNKANEGLQDILKQRQASSVNALNSFFGGAAPGAPTGNAPTGTPPVAGSPSVNTFADQLAPAEAPNPQKVNDQGFSGQFQFGAGRLASTGQYTPAPGEDLKANQWKGSFSIPGFPDVKTHQDFLSSPAAQHAALGIDVANTDKAIAGTPGAEAFDQNGLRAVAHLGGVDGMKQFVQTGGKYNPADSNGTHLSDYYTRFSGSGAQPQPGQAPATGQQAPQTAQSLDLMRKSMAYAAANPYDPQAQHLAAQMMEYAKTLGTLDTFHVDPNTHIQTSNRTGQQFAPVAPLPDYKQDPNNPGVMTSPGQKPIMLPAPRVAQTPSGATFAVGGGGVVTPVAEANNPGVAARASASAQGTTTGKEAALTSGRMVKIGTEAAQGIGTIDSAMSQVNEAQKSGIPTGYFTPALANVAAAAKSLGIDTTKLGVDPSAVSDIQAARKSLAITAGSIMRTILGPESQITEGKLDQFIHATPGIETDPQALQKILGWARSQFVFNHGMAIDAMQHADKDTGMIPPGWEAQYYTKSGSFGPIYNPLHGEMEQPKGQQPPEKMPEQAAAAPPVPGARQAPDKNWYLPDPARPGKYLQVK